MDSAALYSRAGGVRAGLVGLGTGVL